MARHSNWGRVRLVTLEGLSGVGKSWLTREPFISDGWAAETIETLMDFRKDPVGSKSYVSAIDRAAGLEAAIDVALVSWMSEVIGRGTYCVALFLGHPQ